MADFLVAVWSPQWRDFKDLDLQTKARRFAAAAQGAHAAMLAFSTRVGMHAPSMLFAAPEYYFVEDDNFGLLTPERRTTVEAIVRVLSGQLNNMVIVPGSINYRTEAGMMAGAVARGRPQRTYVAQSYCPVYANGGLLNRYYKRFNDGTYDNQVDGTPGFQDAYFLAGNHPGNFGFRGHSMGVDICGDYGESRLAGDVGEGVLDLHVLCSGTHDNVFDESTRIAARDGGYFVHSDSDDHPLADKQKNGVWAVMRGKGMHGGKGRSLAGTASDAALADPRVAHIPADRRLAIKINAHMNRTGAEVVKNVTKMSDLKLNIPGVGNIKVYTCPL